jgi:hypothetical protein
MREREQCPGTNPRTGSPTEVPAPAVHQEKLTPFADMPDTPAESSYQPAKERLYRKFLTVYQSGM